MNSGTKTLPATTVIISISLLACISGLAQGTFVNLDFEHPILPLQPVNYVVPFANALPGWTEYAGDSGAMYNTVALGDAAISLHDHNSSIGPVLQGNYTVGLQGAFGSAPYSAAIGQTGQIPVGSESLQFMAAQLYSSQGASLQVTFNGELLPYTAIGTGSNYTIYGADVSALAGQTGLLMFTAPPNVGAYLDDIRFSVTPVPEPGVLTLSTVGGALLFGFCAHRRKSLK